MLTGFSFSKPAATELLGRDAGHVRLEIEDGSAVEHVDATDVELCSFTAEKFDYGQGDRVGATWGTGRKDSVRAIVGGRRAK